jgi:hypothetical protein
MAAKRLSFFQKPFLLKKRAGMVFCQGFVAIIKLL